MAAGQFSLQEFLRDFDWAVNDFYEKGGRPFENFLQGTSAYFHKRLIQIGRQKGGFPSRWVKGDLHFIELLYAMLSAWGMDSQKPGVADFDQFKRAVEALVDSDIFRSLEGTRIQVVDEPWEPQFHQLWNVLRKDAKIMAGESILVGSSKLLHHLLPDLFPPIDHTYTLDFLSHLRSDEPYHIPPSEAQTPSFKAFLTAMIFYGHVAREKNVDDYLDDNRSMSGSVPKIIDNAIIAWWTAPWDESWSQDRA